MSYTNTDWVTHILRKSAILGEDETPTADQLAEGQKIIASRVAHLSTIGVSMWNGSADAVPEEWFDPGADYMALYFRQGFGGPAPSMDEVNGALIPLRMMTQVRPTGARSEAEYF